LPQKKLLRKKAATKKVAATGAVAKSAAEAPKAKTSKIKTSTTAQTPLPDTLPVLPFASAQAWESWLKSNAAASGLWLKIAKKNSGIATVNYEQALEVALCHGWIDGQKRGFDEQYFLQRFTPRRPKSLWSKINIGHVERLIAAGRMREGGLREVDAAKADGRWDAAYHGASRMEVPEALALALTKNKAAAAFFEALDKTNRYSVCWRVQTAKTEATRASRIDNLITMLARGEKIHA
jgi:uncharacterized protein YdeI (YjbR/CyaY-like superfamily)